MNVARVVDSEAESSDDDEEEGEDDDDAGPPGSTPTDRSSDRTEASSPATATTDGGRGRRGHHGRGRYPRDEGVGGRGQPRGASRRANAGGWRPGAGRPRKFTTRTIRLRGRGEGSRGSRRASAAGRASTPPRRTSRLGTSGESRRAQRRRRRRCGGSPAASAASSARTSPLQSRGVGPGRTVPPRALRRSPPGPGCQAWPRDSRAGGEGERDQHRTMGGSGQEGVCGGNAEASHPDSPPRRREVSFPENEGRRRAEPRDGAASAPRSAPPAPPPSGRYGSDRENEQVSAAKSSRRKSILRTLGKSLGEENERDARRNALDRRYSDVPEFEVFGFQGTPEKGGAASPDFGGSPGLFTAKSPGGLISQLDTDTPVTSPVRSSPRLRG